VANFQLRALRKAARILGRRKNGCARSRRAAGAPSRAGCQGAEPLPNHVFLMIVDFLSDMESGVQPFGSAGETLPVRKR